MNIREAGKQDQQLWDSFVDAQEGSFGYYFDHRYINNKIIQLLIESDQRQLLCLCRFELFKRALYSSISMDDILFKRDLPEDEKFPITCEILKHIENKYCKKCSTFTFMEEVGLGSETNMVPNKAFIDYKFQLKEQLTPGLPCSHILPLKAPFEEHIWKGLWSQKFRQALNRVAKMGVQVIQDRELKYLEVYLDMYAANLKRHGLLLNKVQKMTECNLLKDKIKLFVALVKDQPVFVLECRYTPSTCYMIEVGSFTRDIDEINKYCFKAAIEDACDNGFKYVDFGPSPDEGLAIFKDKFKFVRLPIRTYVKIYSLPRTLFESAMVFINISLHSGRYLWVKRRMIWNMTIHRRLNIFRYIHEF